MGAPCVDWQDESRYLSKKREEKNVLVWFMEFKLKKSDHKKTERGLAIL